MADIGYGATLAFGGFTSAVRSISGMSLSVDAVETTSMTSASEFRTYIKGLSDGGEVSADLLFDPNETPPTLEEKGTLTVTMPIPAGDSSGATWVADAVCTGYDPDIPLDDAMSASCTLKISGLPVFTASS